MYTEQWVISLGADFHTWCVLDLAEIFLIQKFMSPTTEKSHVSDISYKAYMGKTIINLLYTRIEYIIIQSCIHAWSTRECVYVQECVRAHDFPQHNMCTKNRVSYGWTVLEHRVFNT